MGRDRRCRRPRRDPRHHHVRPPAPRTPEHKASAPPGHHDSLAVEAREVTRLATAAGQADLASAVGGHVTGIVTVPCPSRLPDAVTNLAHLLALEQASVPDLLAVTRARPDLPRHRPSAHLGCGGVWDPGTISPPPQGRYREAAECLATAVTSHQTVLRITPGSPLLIAQAREIGAIAVPGLRTLHGRAPAAEAASPHLLAYAETIPTVTAASGREFTALDARGLVVVRDRSETAEHGWRRTTPVDLWALTAHLDDACRAVATRTAPPPIRDADRDDPSGQVGKPAAPSWTCRPPAVARTPPPTHPADPPDAQRLQARPPTVTTMTALPQA